MTTQPEIKLPESDLWAVFHGKALYGVYGNPGAAQVTVDVVPKATGPTALYTAEQVRQCVLADRAAAGWVSVDDELPLMNEPVLLRDVTAFYGDTLVWHGVGVLRQFGAKYWSVIGEGRARTLESVTHWARLPI